MSNPGHVLVVPEVLFAAAGQLNAIADQIERATETHNAALQLAPAGHDEVSVGVVEFHDFVAKTYHAAATSGVFELRRAADMLRTHAALYAERDLAGSVALNTIGSVL